MTFFSIKTASYIWLCLLTYLLLSGLTLFFRGAHIDTDLKSLSPEYIQDENIQKISDKLSKLTEQSFLLVLKSDNEDDLFAAGDTLTEKMAHAKAESRHESRYEFQLSGTADTDALLKLLKQHHLQLLTPSQRETLKKQTPTQWFEYAKNSLYGMGTTIRIFSFKEDPFAYLSDFFMASFGQIQTSEEIIEHQHKGKIHYYMPLRFTIKESSLDMSTQANIHLGLNDLKQALKKQHPKIDFLESGIFFFASDAANAAKKDIKLISILSSICILILLLGLFRSVSLLGLPLLSIASGIALAFVSCHWLFGYVHIITLLFGASLIGVVVDYSLHYFYHMTENNDLQNKKPLISALSISLLTSAVGYGALSLSGLSALKHVALFSIIGLSGAWLTVIVIGAAIIRQPIRIHDGLLTRTETCLTLQINRLPNFFILSLFTTCMLLFLLNLYRGFTFNDDPMVFFKPTENRLQQETKAQSLVSTYEPGSYVVVQGRSVEQVYKKLELLEGSREAGKSKTTFSMASLLPSPAQQSQNVMAYKKLYGEAGLAYTFFQQEQLYVSLNNTWKQIFSEQGTQALEPNELLSIMGTEAPPLWTTYNQQHYALTLLTPNYDREHIENIANTTEGITLIRTRAMAKAVLKNQRQSAFLLLGFAVLTLTLLLSLRYRNIRGIKLMMVPSFAIMATLVIFQTLGIELTLFHIMALFLVLGLGMDYVVFLAELPNKIDRSMGAIVLSALTSLLAFGLLGLSDIPAIKAFGLSVLVGNLLNLGGAMLLSKILIKSKQDALK